MNLGPKSTVAVDQPIVIQFNRFLNPSTVTRQTILLRDPSGQPPADAVIDYDPVLLQVSLSRPAGSSPWLVVGQNYTIDMVPATPTVASIQAIDNATLAVETKFEFQVGPGGSPFTEPTMHFCVDVLPIFYANCAFGGCHGAPQSPPAGSCSLDGATLDATECSPLLPREGLVLQDSDWVLRTAVGVVADESNTGPSAGPSAAGPIFGVDMPIIDPGTSGSGDPGNSWLLYKLLLGVPSAGHAPLNYSCASDSFTTAVSYERGVAPVITPEERGRLSNYILGREMPYPFDPDVPESKGGKALTLAEMERIRLWIKQGATFDDALALPDGRTTCGFNEKTGCNPILDAGAPDAPMKDASPKDATHDGPKDTGAKD